MAAQITGIVPELFLIQSGREQRLRYEDRGTPSLSAYLSPKEQQPFHLLLPRGLSLVIRVWDQLISSCWFAKRLKQCSTQNLEVLSPTLVDEKDVMRKITTITDGTVIVWLTMGDFDRQMSGGLSSAPFTVSYLVGAFSPVDHKGLYQGWGRLAWREIHRWKVQPGRNKTRTEWERKELLGEFVEWNTVERSIKTETDTRTEWKEWANSVGYV